jgi:hypothetical protein
MAARLGNVIYWLGWIIAVAAGVFAGVAFHDAHIHDLPSGYVWWADAQGLKFAGIGFGSLLIGRLGRYILAGR